MNYGFCKGNNIGIKASKGEYIVLLNNDTVVEQDWLKNLYNSLMSEYDIGFCASKMLSYYDKNSIDSAGDSFSICGAAYKIGHGKEKDLFTKDDYIFGACAGAAIYKKEMLDKIGLLDEDFFAIYEDADLSFRAQLAGYRCKLAANAIVYHKVNSTLGKLSDTYVYYGQRNVEYAYFKNMPGKLLIKTLPHHILYNVLAFAYFIKKGKAEMFLKAKFSFFKDFRKVLIKRKEIQKLRTVDNAYLWDMFEKKWLSTRLSGK